MPRQELDPGQVRRVTPRDLRSYATSNEWIRVEGVRGNISVFRRSDGGLDQVIVPDDPSVDDYTARVLDVIRKLATIERRSTTAVLSDILNHDADIVRVRVEGERTLRGSIPLLEAGLILDGLKKSILSAAHSVLSPVDHHPRLSRREAETLVRACRLEQTERGSFVVAVSAPIRAVDSPEERILPDGQTFTRATTTSLLNSLELLSQAIRHDDLRPLVEPDGGQFRVSANLCESILAMRPSDEESVLEYSVSWAPSLPVAIDARPLVDRVRFSPDDFEVIEQVHSRLRPRPTNALNFFVASIDELRGETNDQNRREGEVVLSLYPKDEETVIKARAILTVEQYELADRAHMDNKYVFVRGRLQRERRSARLSDISLFRIPRSEED